MVHRNPIRPITAELRPPELKDVGRKISIFGILGKTPPKFVYIRYEIVKNSFRLRIERRIEWRHLRRRIPRPRVLKMEITHKNRNFGKKFRQFLAAKICAFRVPSEFFTALESLFSGASNGILEVKKAGCDLRFTAQSLRTTDALIWFFRRNSFYIGRTTLSDISFDAFRCALQKMLYRPHSNSKPFYGKMSFCATFGAHMRFSAVTRAASTLGRPSTYHSTHLDGRYKKVYTDHIRNLSRFADFSNLLNCWPLRG